MKYINSSSIPILYLVFIIFITTISTLIIKLNPFLFTAKDRVHIFILMGQSNMAGRAALTNNDTKIQHNIFKLTPDFSWEPASHPLHSDSRNAGFGMGIPFAKSLIESNHASKIILLPLAMGNSRVDQWQKGGELFLRAKTHTEFAKRYGVLKGILWHQGESEAYIDNAQYLSRYSTNLYNFLHDFRNDIESPDLPIFLGLLGDYLVDSQQYPNTTEVNKLIVRVANKTHQAYLIDTSDLSPGKDNIHFNRNSIVHMSNKFLNTYCNKTINCKK